MPDSPDLASEVEPEISVFRPDRPGVRKVLGDLEAEIMELVWSRSSEPGTTVRDVFEVLYERRRIAYTTVMSTMSRLARKKLLRVETGEHAYVYYANFSEQEFVSRFVGRILEDLLVSFTGAPDTLGMDVETTERVRDLLAEVRRRRTAEEPG